jgi:hypothetical protein
VRFASERDLERFVIFVSAMFTFGHNFLGSFLTFHFRSISLFFEAQS